MPPRQQDLRRYLRPYVYRWFRGKYGKPTPPQREAIPLIKKGENVLISSPTGTGKTLAAFLAIIDNLYSFWESGDLRDQVYAIYISPLRALNNDIRRNLMEPLSEINSLISSEGRDPPGIRVAVRTSDTTPHEKQKMLREPPHILITTPETMSIILTAPKFRTLLTNVRWVIIDEIHELASSKRGAHLMLSIERLEELVEGGFQRIGLSATINPLDRIARFLAGFDDSGSPRPCRIVDARFLKKTDIRVICPASDLIRDPPDVINESIYRTLVDIIKKHRTTLIFTNTRHSTEKVVYKLKKLFENDPEVRPEQIEAHHSSLSRSVRLDVEEKLKRGELRVVVSSTSLELGIDIGYIDVVVLLSSPKSVTRLLQRVGRAGHHIRETSIGRLVVVDRDDLVECTVLAKGALDRMLDKVRIPMKPLDILAQHIVGMSLEKKWRIDDIYRVVRRAYNYHTLEYSELLNVVEYLSGKYDVSDFAKVYSKIWFDRDEGLLGRKRSSRMIYYLNSGAIPDEAKIRVVDEKNRYIGDLDESFAEILEEGDIFVLGGRTFQVLRNDITKVMVRKAEGLRPTVPSWFSEMLPLSFDSALMVGRFRRELYARIMENLDDLSPVYGYLEKVYGLQRHAAENIINYFLEHIFYTNGKIPSDKTVVVEVWWDQGWGTTHIIFHYLFGRRVNDALSRSYAYVASKIFRENIRVTVNDNGFMLTLPSIYSVSESILDNMLRSVRPDNINSILRSVIKRTELFKKRFRHCAERGLMILKRYKGEEISLHRRQVNANTLIDVLDEMGDHPIIEETYREILEDYMDIENAMKILEWIHEGRIRVEYLINDRSARAPSPFAHNIVAAGVSDVVLMEDRKKLLVRLHEDVIRELERKGIVLRKYLVNQADGDESLGRVKG